MVIVIPARYASARLPGKPLADVAGKPLIQRVYDCALKAEPSRVIVATDDARIETVCKGFGATVCMTATRHRSGTDRLAEVVEMLSLPADEIVVNLQGDEPLMPPDLIRDTAQHLNSHRDAVVSTACHAIYDMAEFSNPNVVKVVTDRRGYALYFSRAPIPWPRDTMADSHGKPRVAAFRHIGLYAYRAEFITRYAALSPCPPEEFEQLEQLRVLWHGEKIVVTEAKELPVAGVDTPEDLGRVRALFAKAG
jgi:3-deoxy-manno-octulosonate cytidylyltransferase (CMP-KDO synthetase)